MKKKNLENERIIDILKKRYPKGTRVKLIHINDTQSSPTGMEGTIIGIDCIGNIMVDWDDYSKLNVTYGEDKIISF